MSAYRQYVPLTRCRRRNARPKPRLIPMDPAIPLGPPSCGGLKGSIEERPRLTHVVDGPTLVIDAHDRMDDVGLSFAHVDEVDDLEPMGNEGVGDMAAVAPAPRSLGAHVSSSLQRCSTQLSGLTPAWLAQSRGPDYR